MNTEFKGTPGPWKATSKLDVMRNVTMISIHAGNSPEDIINEDGSYTDPSVAGIWPDLLRVDTSLHDANLIAQSPNLIRVLSEIIHICGTVNFSSHNQMREAIEGSLQIAEEALQLSLNPSTKKLTQ